ncbi:MAG: hypothetical protein MJZ81_10470 [Bacteroidales bacterium]|nr:hypothetical protein [Bacteroidales bacterium]
MMNIGLSVLPFLFGASERNRFGTQHRAFPLKIAQKQTAIHLNLIIRGHLFEFAKVRLFLQWYKILFHFLRNYIYRVFLKTLFHDRIKYKKYYFDE